MKMSTRCQIGFYASASQPLNQPDVVLYRHCDGYPEGVYGVRATLVPWARDFERRRGLADVEYAAARGLVALIAATGEASNVLGYGICGDKALHGDIEYYYRVDPKWVIVYDAPDEFWQANEVERHAIAATQGAV